METMILTDELKNWKPNIAEISDRLIMGPQRDALEKVRNINNRYGLSLGITKTYRWSPGYMDQVKDYMATKYLEPHMKRKISTYFNQIDNKAWTYKNLRDNMNQLDDILFEMRSRNQKFQDNTELVERVWDGVRGILEYEIKNNTSYYNIYMGHYNLEFNSSWRSNENQINKPAIVFAFYLPETVCNYFIGRESYPIPIYAATLYYAIDFDDFLYRISANTSWLDDENANILSPLRNRNYSGNHGSYNQFYGSYHRNYINEGATLTHQQLLHPYISSEEAYTTKRFTIDMSKEKYKTAYCCLGDYTTPITNALHKLDLGKIYSILYNWHTVFNSSSTHPMNNPRQMFFGKHKFMDKTFTNVISADEENCRIKANSTHGPTTYCDDYECLHRKTCSYYNYDPDKAIVEASEDDHISPADFNISEEVEAAIDSVTDEERQEEATFEEYRRIAEENGIVPEDREPTDGENIHGGEYETELSIEEQMIIWASQRGGAINIVNNERENNG